MNLTSAELMTNNYIQKNGVIHKVTVIFGSETNKRKGIKKSAVVRTDKTSESVFLDQFEPILITKDILKKLGFTRSGDFWSSTISLNYVLHQGKSGDWNILLDSNIYEGYVNIRIIEYVHTLQNFILLNTNNILSFNKPKLTSKK